MNRLLPSLTAGIMVGVIVILVEISFAALIFSGDLSGYVSSGIGLLLLGAFIIGVVVALTSSFPGMVALPQDSPVAILALMAAAIAGSMPASATPESLFFTVVAAIAVTSLLTGVFFLVLGSFELGSLVQFIPYPVVGGFLAGTGWLLVKGAIGVMTDTAVSFSTGLSLFQFSLLLKWLPGVLLGVLLLGIQRRYSHFLIMPALTLAAIALFYGSLFLTGTSLTEAEAQGWLLGPFPKGGLWQPMVLSSLHHVHWSVIFEQIGSIGTILIISVISLLLNAGGIELAVRRDIDLDRELRSAGIANLIAGLGGSPTGYQALTLSMLGHKLGPNRRIVGLISAMLCGATFLFGASLLSFIPKPVVGGLLVFLGLAFLTEWVYDARRTLPRADYLLVLLILAAVGAFGFLPGVVVGIVVAVVLFVVNYSHIDIIKHVLSGADFRSNVDRAVPHQRLLHEKGHQLLIFKLQGFIFFGTAHNLLDRVRRRAADPNLGALRFVALDFRMVTGLDSSAMNSFTKMKQLAQAQHMTLVLTGLSPQMERQFLIGGYVDQEDPVVRISPDLDHGVEWCEEQILGAEAAAETPAHDQDAEAFLGSSFDAIVRSREKQDLFESIVSDMMTYFERQEVEKGCYLIHQGDRPKALYFIKSGQVTVQFEPEEGRATRVRTMSSGTVVGELGFYLGRPASASVVVEQPGTIYRLSLDAFERMNVGNPRVAALFHEFMAHLLGERLANTNDTLQALLD